MPDPEGGPARIDDTLAENLAEEFLESATRGELAACLPLTYSVKLSSAVSCNSAESRCAPAGRSKLRRR